MSFSDKTWDAAAVESVGDHGREPWLAMTRTMGLWESAKDDPTHRPFSQSWFRSWTGLVGRIHHSVDAPMAAFMGPSMDEAMTDPNPHPHPRHA